MRRRATQDQTRGHAAPTASGDILSQSTPPPRTAVMKSLGASACWTSHNITLALAAIVVSLVAYFVWPREGGFYNWWKAGAKKWHYVASFVLITADLILAVQLAKAEVPWSGYAAFTIISSFLAKDYAQHFTVDCGARPRRKRFVPNRRVDVHAIAVPAHWFIPTQSRGASRTIVSGPSCTSTTRSRPVLCWRSARASSRSPSGSGTL